MSEVVESSALDVRLGEEKEEEKLKAQQTEQQDGLKFKTVFENANDCMFVLDISGRILDVNKKAVTLFGRTKEELYGKHFSRVNAVSPKDVPRLVSGLAEVFAGKKSSLMLNVRSKMGREIALDCSGSLMKVGDKPSVLVIARDISERMRMEEALRESEERHRNLFELAPDGILTSDLKGNVTSVNEAFLRITGFSKEEIVGKHFTKLPTLREMDMPNYMKLFFSYLRGKKVGPVEFTYRRKDGTLAWGDAHPALLKEKGKVTGFQVVLRDITERKKAEAKVKESQQKFERLFMGVPEAAVYVDQHDRVLDINPRFTELFGYSLDESKGKPLDDLIVPVEKKKEAIELTEKSKKGHVYVETIRRTKNGSLISVSLSGSSLVVEGQHIGDVILYRDITERKKAEDALRKSENKYRTLLENLPKKIFFKDKNSVYISCNENYARDLKINSNEITGNTDYDFYPKELAEKYRADDKRIMESGKTEDIEEEYIQDGQKAFVHTVKTPVKDENGNVVGILGIFRDITEQKKVREELIRLSSAVKMSTDSIVISDLDGKIIDVNEATLKMFGTDDKKDLIGKNSFDLIASDEREKALAGMKEVLEKGYLKGREYNIVTKDGNKIPVEMSVSIMKDADSKPTGFVGISRDITERKQMESALKKSEERYRDLVEREKDIIYSLDDKGNITFANPAVETILGYEPEEVIGKNFMALVPKELQEKTGADFNSILEKGEITAQTVLLDKKRQPHHVEYSSTVIKEENKVVGTRGIVRDITERKQMEEKLKQYSEHLEELVQKRTEELLESEKRYSVLVEEASDGVAILQDGKIVFANRRGPEIIGYSKDEIIGLPFEKLVSEKHRQLAKERYKQRLRGEIIPSTYEIGLIAKTGNYIPVELSATRINYQGRPADLLVVRDIKERKQMEEQRSRLEKLVTIGELATMVGHDLRNPLQSIENAIYYLKNECAGKPPCPFSQRAKEMMQVINDSINYADKILRDLQDFSAPKAPALKETDINTLITETLSQVKAPENVQLRTELAQLPQIKVDKDQIKRVFLNLTTNGIQATENGGTLTISTKKTEDFVEVSFKDTGVGIPKQNMEKLFTPFFTTKAKGMGMGLPICKKFVDAHGGNIEVKSEVGKGTTFTVKFPIPQESGGEKA